MYGAASVNNVSSVTLFTLHRDFSIKSDTDCNCKSDSLSSASQCNVLGDDVPLHRRRLHANNAAMANNPYPYAPFLAFDRSDNRRFGYSLDSILALQIAHVNVRFLEIHNLPVILWYTRSCLSRCSLSSMFSFHTQPYTSLLGFLHVSVTVRRQINARIYA